MLEKAALTRPGLCFCLQEELLLLAFSRAQALLNEHGLPMPESKGSAGMPGGMIVMRKRAHSLLEVRAVSRGR